MKKFYGLILVFAITAFCLTFVGCGGVEGTYKFNSFTYNGNTINAGKKFKGITIDKDYFVITLKSDNKYEASLEGDTDTGVWGATESGYVLVSDEEGERVAFSISGNTLTILINDYLFVLKK